MITTNAFFQTQNFSRITLWLAVIVCLGTLGTGCDEIRFRERDGFTQAPVMQPTALRMQVSWTGLESMYRNSSPQGFSIQGAPLEITEPAREIRLGPLEQHLPIEHWTVMPQVDNGDFSASVSMKLSRPRVYVPIRVQTAHAVQICRFEVSFETLSIRANVSIEHTAEGPVLGIGQSPEDAAEVVASETNMRTIGPCTSLHDQSWIHPEPLGTLLQNYVETTLLNSAEAAFRASPLDTLGLIRRRVELSRISAFENRRGALLVSGKLADSQGLAFHEQGLDAQLDVALGQQRAGCAPALGLDAAPLHPAGTISAGLLAQFQADVGLAMSVPLLERLAHAATAAGFVCRGLEDPRPADENREVIPTDILRLQDLGLENLEIGPWAQIAIGPGSLPTLQARVDKNDLLLKWPRLTLDLYAEIHGVLVRLVNVQADIEMGLIPRADIPGMIGFEIDAVDVKNIQLESAWMAEQPTQQKALNWTRRLMFIALDGQISLPLPLDPTTQLRVVGTQIREDSLIVLLRF